MVRGKSGTSYSDAGEILYSACDDYCQKRDGGTWPPLVVVETQGPYGGFKAISKAQALDAWFEIVFDDPDFQGNSIELSRLISVGLGLYDQQT